MKVAALDLGSNSFLLLLCEVTNHAVTKVFQDEITVTRLAEGVHSNRKFSEAALQRAEACLSSYSKEILKFQPEKVLAFATSAARDVTNKDALFALGEKYGIPIKVIPGEKEADLTFAGATYDKNDLEGVGVIDVGGGSTEIVGTENKGVKGVSVDVGSVRLTELFVGGDPVSASEISKMEAYVIEKFGEKKHLLPKITNIIAVAGTPTTLSTVIQKCDYSDEAINGHVLDLAEVGALRDQLAQMPLNDRKNIVGMDPKRADVIVAGTTILKVICEQLGMGEVIVSSRGVRFGMACLWDQL
ncbi:MAG: Ppx/GppA family phosphatase [Pseudobdellovibrionaceae bacterium]|nr:MAG: Ppx/GppA family phosphatase [Pseudobdellovibrionaceae bacterium]